MKKSILVGVLLVGVLFTSQSFAMCFMYKGTCAPVQFLGGPTHK